MTPQELKASILRRAFQGKLVDQIFEEGTGADLFPTIQSECHDKIVTGQIKKFKVFPEITDEDVDFDVPDNWKLIRLGAICQLLDGEKRSGDALPYLEARYLRGKTAPTIMTEGKYIAEGTNVILVDGENSGEVFHIPENGYMGSTFKVLFVPEALLLKYVICFLQLHKNTLRNNKKGAAIPHLNKDIFFNLILPIPPLAEQKRIVAKIEELLPLIDRYEQAWSKLEDFNKRFPVDMQKSILQMAIQGKLVEQLPEEGTGEELFQQIQEEKQALIETGEVYREKQLTSIAEDEIPFEIPDSWVWCKLGELTKTITKGSSPKWQGVSYTDKEYGILFITSENVGVEQLLLSKEKYVGSEFNTMHPASVLQKGDLLTNIVGASIGRTAIFDLDVTGANINQAVCIIRLVNQDVSEYILKFLNSTMAVEMMGQKSVDSARANLSLTSVTNLLIPLPPLAEQKRIVAKLEEILPLCERLK